MSGLDSFFGIMLSICLAMLLVVIAALPWLAAREANHARPGSVLVLNLIGLVIWPLWLVAMAWALIGERKESDGRDYGLEQGESEA